MSRHYLLNLYTVKGFVLYGFHLSISGDMVKGFPDGSEETLVG
jgi:hypothetical protein